MRNLFEWISQHQVWQKIGILVVLGAAVYLILPQINDLENSWQVVTSMARWAVGLAFIAQFLSYLGSGFLLQGILSIAHQKVSLWLNTMIVLGSYSLGMVAGVVGNSAAIYRWTGGGKGSMEGATLASIFLPQFNSIMLVLVSIFGLVHLILVHDLTQVQTIGVRRDFAYFRTDHRQRSTGGALPEPGYCCHHMDNQPRGAFAAKIL